MFSFNDPLEIIWDGLLSCEPEQIKRTFDSLDQSSQQSVLIHLQHMAQEPGWLPSQQQSAQFALHTLLPDVDTGSLPID